MIPKSVIKEVRERSQDRCEVCGREQYLQFAHKVAKGMGGRKGQAKIESNSADNIAHLCLLCHSHLSHNIRSTIGNVSCKTCFLYNKCEEKAILLGIRPDLP